MNWNLLLNSLRRKPKSSEPGAPVSTSFGRAELERDFDRILFCTPTRRLADKTQVFPLDANDSVRTRLTHSYEVSNLARGIGNRLVFELKDEIFGEVDPKLALERNVPSLLAAIGLAHDLGNPPFGHQGEVAIQKWFEKNKEQFIKKEDPDVLFNDFLRFDGNSQTFRLVTRLQILNDSFGINLTYATLAALIKYPQGSSHHKTTWKKHGFFYSEQDIVSDVWGMTGLGEGIRHPLTYLMEACDDIAYSVLDAEDLVKKGLASFYDLINSLQEKNPHGDEHDDKVKLLREVIKLSLDKNEEFKKQNISPAELNDISMQMFRVYAISFLVDAIVKEFKKSPLGISGKDLMSQSDGALLCGALKDFDSKLGYRHKSVLKLELQGYNYIHKLMDMLWIGIHGALSETHENQFRSQTPFGKYVYGRISENYRRVFEDKGNTLPIWYKEAQLLTDAISGMTDTYLISLHNELSDLIGNEAC
ncbi:MAG: deoxyguanosinetriphosphate triphosphohydrolase family protein [Aeromonas sobria]